MSVVRPGSFDVNFGGVDGGFVGGHDGVPTEVAPPRNGSALSSGFKVAEAKSKGLNTTRLNPKKLNPKRLNPKSLNQKS